MDRYLVRNTGQQAPPEEALLLGREDDEQEYFYLVVAHTDQGNVPAKVSSETNCFYAWEGRVHETNNFSWIVAPPASVTLRKNDDIGPPRNAQVIGSTPKNEQLYGVVAETEWGSIPAMATHNTCWYTCEGQVHETSYYYWVLLDPLGGNKLVRNLGQNTAPQNAVLCGMQNNEELFYMGVAHTRWGNIPGKANEDTCWFGYDGEEKYTSDFSWLVTPNCNISFAKIQTANIPYNAIEIGKQTDGVYFAAVANSPNGKVPGKAKMEENKVFCWYAYGGYEEFTEDFEWLVVVPAGYLFKKNEPKGMPRDALMLGQQFDSKGDIYLAVVVHKDWGLIPCKAKDGVASFSYDGREFETEKFLWICAPRQTSFLMKCTNENPPKNIIKTGDYIVAVAIDQLAGRIPGKAKENTCWYAYGDEERCTSEFYWVVIDTFGSGSPILTGEALFSLPPPQKESQVDGIDGSVTFVPQQLIKVGSAANGKETSTSKRTKRNALGKCLLLPADWRDCITVIGSWMDNNCTVRSSSKTLMEIGDVRLVYRNGKPEENPRFARIKVFVGEYKVARVYIHMGVEFGAERIRKALSFSLQQKCCVTLSRQ